jgi:hypothetical protein
MQERAWALWTGLISRETAAAVAAICKERWMSQRSSATQRRATPRPHAS